MSAASPEARAAEPGAPAATDCSHCGLPVPPDLREPGAALQFCCAGCRTVHAVLAESGLGGTYYRIAAAADAREPARSTGRSYAEYDEPAFQERHVRPAPGGLRAAELYLEGVHCGACVWLVEKLPRLVPGVVEARLDLGRSTARVRWDPERVGLGSVARGIDALGYPVHPVRGLALREARRREDRAYLARIAVAGAVAGNVMLMAFALYGGMFAGMEASYRSFFHWLCLGLTLVAVAGPGRLFLRGAWRALRARSLHMDQPIALGLVAGTAWGAWNTVRGAGDVYFDTVTVLVFLLLVGRWLERRQQRKAADAADLLQSLQPTSARVVDGQGVAREVPLEAVGPGTTVDVRQGEAIPIDGAVRSGTSHLDTSLLTGESRPVQVGPGDAVAAGTVNLAAPLRIATERTGEDTRVGRLLQTVADHARRKAPVVALADRIAGWFVAAVVLLAAATALLWLRLDPEQAVDHAVALLIVTCPCALGLATPLAVSVAIGRAARRGVLIKGGDVIQRLARPGRVWLDKTGTLTEGRSRLVRWKGPDDVRPLVLAVEAGSAHPVALGFQAAWRDDGLDVPAGEARREGPGLIGAAGGRAVRVGAPGWVRGAATAPEPAWVQGLLAAALAAGETPVLVAVDGAVVAGAGFGDPLRGDARDAVARLRALGWRVGVLSGDHPEVVAAVARSLDLEPTDCAGGLLPEDKLARVEASRAAGEGPVVMVGDGVNDAAALAAADVGIGVHGSAEATLAAADVFLTRSELPLVAEVLAGAAHTLATIRRNLGLSLVYNVAGASLAIAGLIDPLLAAVLMPLSSITVIASSSRAWRGAA